MRYIKLTRCVIFILFVLTSCSRRPATTSDSGQWPMYQLAASHNAVLQAAYFRYAWKFDAKARINGGLAVIGHTLLLDTFDQEVIALDLRNGQPIWRYKGDNVIMSTPVVAEHSVYIGTGHNGRLLAPTDNRYTYTPNEPGDPTWGRPSGDTFAALRLSDGTVLWHIKTVGEDMPSPLFSKGILVFANGDLHAYGVRASDGSVVWKRQLKGLADVAPKKVSG